MNITYNSFSTEVLSGKINQEDDFRLALLSSEYEPLSDTDTRFSQIRGYEITATGYDKGGKPLHLKSGVSSDYIRYTTVPETIKWVSTDLSCRYAVLYREADEALAACFDLGDIYLSEADDTLTLTWDNTYILSFRVADSSDLNAKKVKDDIYQTIVEHTPDKLKENVRDYVIKDEADDANIKDALKKGTHEYIIENSDTELDEESTNTIQNSAILSSTSGMENSDIDSMFN